MSGLRPRVNLRTSRNKTKKYYEIAKWLPSYLINFQPAAGRGYRYGFHNTRPSICRIIVLLLYLFVIICSADWHILMPCLSNLSYVQDIIPGWGTAENSHMAS